MSKQLMISFCLIFCLSPVFGEPLNGQSNECIVQSDSLFLCPTADGMFSHNQCSKFWHCSNCLAYEKDCPSDLHWNAISQQCDWAKNAGCAQSEETTTEDTTTDQTITETSADVTTVETTTSDDSTATEFTGSDSTATDSTVTDTTNTETTTTESTTLTETEAPTEDTTSSQYRCSQGDGLYAHDDCRKFWQCGNGIAFERDCAPGTAWNNAIKTCDWPSVVNCLINSSNLCRKAGALYQDRYDCRHFYQCDLSYRAFRMRCSEGKYFNEAKGVCDYLENVKCFDGSNSD